MYSPEHLIWTVSIALIVLGASPFIGALLTKLFKDTK